MPLEGSLDVRAQSPVILHRGSSGDLSTSTGVVVTCRLRPVTGMDIAATQHRGGVECVPHEAGETGEGGHQSEAHAARRGRLSPCPSLTPSS